LGGAVHFIRSVSRGLIAFDGDTLNPSLGYRQQEIAFFFNFFQEFEKPAKTLGKCGVSMG
jgi:hypothetical protein